MNDTSQLQDIYRQTVIEHSRNPRNFRRLATANRQIEGHNPLCGDKLTVYLLLTGERITDISFEGTGCAISIASSSIMTELLNGKAISDAQSEIDRVYREFSTSEKPAQPVSGEMAALSGVRNYPSRIKCALLGWKAAAAALQDDKEIITTED